MENRRIGRLTNVSVVGLGCNNFGMRLDGAATKTVVSAALDAGITYFDTAESYGAGRSEEFLGAALAGRREAALVATKWPHTPIDETLGALAELVAEGKVREIGCTAFGAVELDEAIAAAGRLGVRAFPSIQNHYSLLAPRELGRTVKGLHRRCQVADRGRVGRMGCRTGPHPARALDELAHLEPACRIGHRWGDIAHPGRGQRGRGTLGDDRGRATIRRRAPRLRFGA